MRALTKPGTWPHLTSIAETTPDTASGQFAIEKGGLGETAMTLSSSGRP